MAGMATTFGFPYTSQFLLGGHHSCCENATVPLAPHAARPPRLCSCQFEQVLHSQQKMNSLPLGLLPHSNPSYPAEPNIMFGSRDSAVAYTPLLRRQCDVKDMGTAALNTPWFVNPARYEHQSFERGGYLTCHAYADRFSPIDLNSGARRKNATRETTSTLKAWLYEHRKNPYPTKGEKIMLAILTKMTLTQVSTWFANARRRLKKENKMTWSPRNRCGERKDSEGYSDEEDDDDETDSKMKEVKSEERGSFRKTTVIKSPQDISTHYTTEPVTTPTVNSREDETTNAEKQSHDGPFPSFEEQRKLWSSTEHSVETKNRRIQRTSSMEDSPVKSLRKWVDGCFETKRTHNAQTLVNDTPPQTPPAIAHTSERANHLTELEEHQTERQSRSPSPRAEDHVKESKDRSREEQSDKTSNREIDAALALTTLFGSRS